MTQNKEVNRYMYRCFLYIILIEETNTKFIFKVGQRLFSLWWLRKKDFIYSVNWQ